MAIINQDQRNFPRYDTGEGLPIKIAYPCEEEKARKVGFRRAKNISLGGLRFDSNQEVSKNEPVSIHIALKEQTRTIKQEAVVSWTKKNAGNTQFEIGVEFVEASPRDTQLWERFVSRQAQSES